MSPTSDKSAQARRNKRNGSQWETDLVKHFRGLQVEADRLHLSGKNDEGDILVRLANGARVVVEAKSGTNIRPKEWHREAEVEAKNYATHRDMAEAPVAMVVMKKHGRPVNEAYVVLSLKDLERLMPL